MRKKRSDVVCTILFAIAVLVPNLVSAHFPWLILDDDAKPVLFFGEDLSDRAYHLPESLAAFSLDHVIEDGKPEQLSLKPVETDELVGLIASQPIKPLGCVFGTQTFGNYHGTKLVYYVQHFLGEDSKQWKCPAAEMALKADIEPHEDGIRVTVLWDQKPLADVEVKLSCDDGAEQGIAKTNSDGCVVFTGKQLKTGLHGIMVGFNDAKPDGSAEAKSQEATSSYLTATFQWEPSQVKKDDTAKTDSASEVEVVASRLPDLPIELTSFGGAITNETIYVYGGHIGDAHSYSTAEQSDAFYSLDLNQSKQWVALPSGPKLQGLAMVAHGPSVIRFGGFTAKNEEGEEHDLHSQNLVSRYDPETRIWKDLTPLPEPRSSHAAALLGNNVYVIGGWAMSGDENAQWHQTAWVADLEKQPLVWKPIANPPESRRALAVTAFDGKIFAIGGMEQEGGPSTRTDVYDPQSNKWIQGPSLLGDSMTGFGCWAEPLGGSLYASTISGTVQRLSPDQKEWKIVGNYEPGRFFHCMLPWGEHQFVMVGGANMEIGRFTNLDLVNLSGNPPEH
jgi:N-acetylneuraminic acid mutarotase